ncbi:hypothetical protein [Intestinibacter bartlettii]|uniref:hypothetical protein n=1 Tax=Intestinibacter bartlettii TaxID=261299 RepID=UPI0029038085|nr:hypothetical protein [Intestinibacter bartlettii]MDU2163093.1 hypothetical protein [Intestinibacter bartlettii]
MSIEFRPKTRGDIDIEVINLKQFLLINKDYIKTVFFILCVNKETIDEGIIELSFTIDELKGVKNNECKDLLMKFYNFQGENLDSEQRRSKVGNRRGELLELVVNEITPVHVKSSEYTLYKECCIYENGQMIKHMDIDTVFESRDKTEAELIECKVDLSNYLGDDIPYSKRKKLNFMVCVENKSRNYGYNYKLFFATCEETPINSRVALDKHGYNMFNILNCNDIIKQLN